MQWLKILPVVLLLCACVPKVETPTNGWNYLSKDRTFEHGNVLYVGDSLCEIVMDDYSYTGIHFVDLASIDADCKAGRKSTEYQSIPEGYDTVFFALITNDCNVTPIDEYRAHLQDILMTSSTVYCVLPTSLVNGISCDAWAQVMKEECTNTIQPKDYGVLPGASDGYHWTATDHANFAAAIEERL